VRDGSFPKARLIYQARVVNPGTAHVQPSPPYRLTGPPGLLPPDLGMRAHAQQGGASHLPGGDGREGRPLTAWRTVLLAVADDAIAAAVLVIALAWLAMEGFLAPAVALLIGIAGTAILLVIAYKTAAVLLMSPKVVTSMVGRRGNAVTEIKPDGMVLIEGELWKASSREPIEKGAAAIVVGAEGLRLIIVADKNG